MKKSALKQMKRIALSHSLAIRQQNITVDYTRDEVIEEAYEQIMADQSVFLMGVKNTAAISYQDVQKLAKFGFLFHTLDNINEKGRAIYTQLTNPLTGRPMTGSSASTCINIMKNINQVGLGTDGGGSVLAPALSCSLYAIMGKGLGLLGQQKRISTDQISFQPGIGIIAQKYENCMKIVQALIQKNVKQIQNKKLCIGIVHWQEDTDNWVNEVQLLLKGYNFKVFRPKKTSSRVELIEIYEKISQQTQIILSQEGPIDLNGLGDSVLGQFGKLGKEIQDKGGKYFVKIANMVDATAVAIPNGQLASGYLIMGIKGLDFGLEAIKIGAELAEKISLPKVYQDYFFGESETKGFLI